MQNMLCQFLLRFDLKTFCSYSHKYVGLGRVASFIGLMPLFPLTGVYKRTVPYKDGNISTLFISIGKKRFKV